MAHTHKTEYSKPDSWHLNHRLERKARPAGRLAQVIEAELDQDYGEVHLICYVPAEQEPTTTAMWELDDDFCFVCGRCTDHFAEHDDLVELGYAFYDERGTARWTDAGWAWNMEQGR